MSASQLLHLLANWSIPLGSGRRLVLAGGLAGWFWIGAGLCALVLLAVLYGYERRLVSRRVGLALLLLRAAAALALAAALLEPVAEQAHRETLRGRVILGVDLSASMATSDVARSAEERSRLAQSLAKGEDAPQTRREISAALLEGPWGGRVQALGPVDAIGFARVPIRDVAAAALAKILRDGAGFDDPDRMATDWGPVLERAKAATPDAPLLGVVLLSDGRETAPAVNTRQATVEQLAARKIPIYSIIVGSTAPARDAAVAALEIPDRVLKGDSVEIRATLKLDGEVPGSEVPVRLERPGAAPEQRMVRVPTDGSRPATAFHVQLDRVGFEPITVRVGPVAGDLRPDNDARSATLEVVDEKIRVLLIESEPRWEFRYLHNALSRDPHVTLEATVFRQQPGESSSVSYGTKLPDPTPGEPDPLNGFDLIVVGDVRPSDAPAAVWERLARFVDLRGGTLVWSGGPHTVELLNQLELARRMIPVSNLSRQTGRPGEVSSTHPSLPNGVTLVPADFEAAARWPMLRLADPNEQNRAVWDALPGQPWVWRGEPKPTTEVIATAENGDQPGSRAVMGMMPFGLGRVFWIGFDGTWRWRHRAGDTRHHRFWGQLVRWASAERLSAGNEHVRFGTAGSRFEQSREIKLRARFAENVKRVGADWLVVGRVYRAPATPPGSDRGDQPADEPIAFVTLKPSVLQPRLFEGVIPRLAPGTYTVALEVPQLSEKVPEQAFFEVTTGESSELIELTASADAGARLATLTGGGVWRDFEAMQLFDKLKPRETTRARIETTTVWDRPWALVAFFTILTVEWVLRKRAGLP